MPFNFTGPKWSEGGLTRNLDARTDTRVYQAQFTTATAAGIGVSSVAVTGGGSGYTTPPTVSFTGGGGSGAAAFAKIDGAGNITGVVVTQPGHNYTSAPAVGFSGGGGSGATATATISQCDVNTKEACRRALAELLSIDINTAHPDDAGMLVNSIEVASGLNLRDVTVRYSVPAAGGKHPNSSAQDPATRPTTYRWASGFETFNVDRDFNGQPIVNSAWQRFDNDPTVTKSHLILEITRTYTLFNIADAFTYYDKVNSTTWNLSVLGITVPEGLAKCTGILPTDPITANSDTIEVRHVFELRPEGHQVEVLDQGTVAAIDNISDLAEPIQTAQNVYATSQILLNGKGGVLKDTYSHTTGTDWGGKPAHATPIATGSAWKLRYEVYGAVDFNALGF